ncbi:hypothetical protein KBI23_20800 [bacterium]|nr:hypothetical protein [bacterium]
MVVGLAESRPGVLSLSDSATQTTLQTSMVPPFEIYDLAQTKTIVGLDAAATARPIDTSQSSPNSKVDQALQCYTVSQLLEFSPKELPHNFILQTELGASPQAELIDISYAQMIRQMGLSSDTSQEDIERIRRARELRLPDEASIEEVTELEANWNQRKEQLEQDCQI